MNGEIPPLVLEAEREAAERGFAQSSRREVGALLAAVVAAKPDGVMAESGTGTGIATAWMQSALGGDARLLTVERDPGLAAYAAELLVGDPRVEVLHGDWTLLVDRAPFDVFFCDGGGKRDDPDLVVSLLAPGGVLVLDDFVPATGWPPLYEGRPDALRLRYLTDPLLVATEVRVAPDAAVVVTVRRP